MTNMFMGICGVGPLRASESSIIGCSLGFVFVLVVTVCFIRNNYEGFFVVVVEKLEKTAVVAKV